MYDYEYENDVLLFLRLLKFLHTEHPFVLEQIIKDYPTADEEDIWMILDELLMAVFDEGAPDEGDDMMTVRFSDERIDRLYTQGCKHSEILPYDKADGIFRCDNMVYDDAVDVPECCRRAEELFELYQRCANRKQIETICTNYLRALEATKLSITGHMYFVPHTYMDQVDIFEDFILLLSGLNKKATPLVVNSFYIIDDAKQREKMTEEFYLAVKKEIAAYQEKCDYLIKSTSQSPAVMDRWVLKVRALEEKKRHYEGVLQRELSGLDDEFSVLKLLSQELQVRANSIRSQRFQQRAA